VSIIENIIKKSVLIDEMYHSQFKEICKEEGLNMTDVANRIVEGFLGRYKKINDWNSITEK